MSISQKQAARKFVEYWTFQRGEDQQFWNTLLLQYNMRWNSAYQHSAMYDTGGFNYGGAYPHGKTKKR